MQIGGFSFQSYNVEKTLDLYNKLFGWKILQSSPYHGELRLNIAPSEESSPKENFLKLYISPISGKCPTDPGTMTLQLNPLEHKTLISHSLWIENFKEEYKDKEHFYSSFLDPWRNRIFLLYTEE